MICKADILPTGNELSNGIVLDTDSPMLMQELLRLNNNCLVCRHPVTEDSPEAIEAVIKRCVAAETDLIILIGGSGSGHLHSNILGKDYTHMSMERILEEAVATSLYGKNGHMWSRLVCGRIGKTLVVNVPGPYVEANAAILAFCSVIGNNPTLHQINQAMADAVAECYKTNQSV